jgi:phosphatidylserine decarboxylase
MRIDPAGWPFIVPALAAAALVAALGYSGWAIPLLLLAGLFLFFFRDPDRRATTSDTDVLSPADGRVVVAERAAGDSAPPGSWQQISIFLSPIDVHVNRVPVGGRVTRVEYQPGRFLPAYKPEAASGNERTEIWIDHQGQMVVCRQVVGVLARRIVCRVAPGSEVEAGERLGVMKFGSRMDLFLPPAAVLCVSAGDRVRAGVTVVAKLPELGV